tara:strand:+ start:1807 stop:2610 length:804 start_codon:yes stop_codon:yes gene_type:complete
LIPRLGIFDSGLGGFSVLKSVTERHGDVSCLYLADTARVPYGDKKPEEIRAIAKEIVQWLSIQDISAILVACNTTNSLAFDVVKSFAKVPVFGLIESAVEMITESRVGVLATSATASSCSYTNQIEAVKPGTIVFEQPCPAFVPLIEQGQLCGSSLQAFALEYLTPLLDAGVEALILGCSHYPILLPFFQDIIPKHIRLVDPAIGLAKKLDMVIGMPDSPLVKPLSICNTRFCVTSEPNRFASRIGSLLGNRPQVELVSLLHNACFF